MIGDARKNFETQPHVGMWKPRMKNLFSKEAL